MKQADEIVLESGLGNFLTFCAAFDPAPRDRLLIFKGAMSTIRCTEHASGLAE